MAKCPRCGKRVKALAKGSKIGRYCASCARARNKRISREIGSEIHEGLRRGLHKR